MLILSRKPGQSLRIGDNIVVTVVSLREGQVRIGIEAPADTKILRSELGQREKSADAEAKP